MAAQPTRRGLAGAPTNCGISARDAVAWANCGLSARRAVAWANCGI
jgi:hypothetical protein